MQDPHCAIWSLVSQCHQGLDDKTQELGVNLNPWGQVVGGSCGPLQVLFLLATRTLAAKRAVSLWPFGSAVQTVRHFSTLPGVFLPYFPFLALSPCAFTRTLAAEDLRQGISESCLPCTPHTVITGAWV